MTLWNEPIYNEENFTIADNSQDDIFNAAFDILPDEGITSVFLNGMRLSRNVDYSITGPRSIKLTEPVIGFSVLTIITQKLG